MYGIVAHHPNGIQCLLHLHWQSGTLLGTVTASAAATPPAGGGAGVQASTRHDTQKELLTRTARR